MPLCSGFLSIDFHRHGKKQINHISPRIYSHFTDIYSSFAAFSTLTLAGFLPHFRLLLLPAYATINKPVWECPTGTNNFGGTAELWAIKWFIEVYWVREVMEQVVAGFREVFRFLKD